MSQSVHGSDISVASRWQLSHVSRYKRNHQHTRNELNSSISYRIKMGETNPRKFLTEHVHFSYVVNHINSLEFSNEIYINNFSTGLNINN